MNKTTYNQMVQAQDTQHVNAWRFVLDNWLTSTWRPLPQGIRLTLGLSANMGVCSGMLVTKAGAEGVSEFVYRLNHRKGVS